MAFKMLLVSFLNKHPKMKKSSLSLHVLNNNFKITKEICHENASEFKYHFFFSKFNYFKIIL